MSSICVLFRLQLCFTVSVNNEANSVKVVRQYQGSFAVTNGPDTIFDREALNKDSDAFKKIAAVFAKKVKNCNTFFKFVPLFSSLLILLDRLDIQRRWTRENLRRNRNFKFSVNLLTVFAFKL